ncbi:MAG: bifunctional transaldolase/phosoglucose isomerase [Syntrophobacteria bacterium]
MHSLLQLRQYGQSYWLDNLTRRMINDGELKRRVTEKGLRGVTSNPAIFNKAISASEDYDEQIRDLVGSRLQVHQIYEELVVTDVRDACDLLRPVYDESEGVDGFVSLEVSPYLAHDTEGTMSEARRLYHAVDRPNVLIKIPGTPEGTPAVEQMLYEGVNVNITLLFSIQNYEAVAEAYIKALERRRAAGRRVDNVASVASFFLSRIDVLTDQLLAHRFRSGLKAERGCTPEQLLGRLGIASGKLAYQSFKKLRTSERWKALEREGARVQRLLWASTSSKSPLYSDVYYVEPLIGPDTVNTMPSETIAAFADHGEVIDRSVEIDVEDSRQVFTNLKEVGVNPELVTEHLLNEGVQKFLDPFDKLMATLAQKRQQFLGNKLALQTVTLGKAGVTVQAGLAALDGRQFGRRMAEGDPFLWTSVSETAEKIGNRLGWLRSIAGFREKVDEIAGFAAGIREADFRHVVLLGMGGSSLCPEVCAAIFGSATGWPHLLVLDNTDPAAVRTVESQIDLAKTLFIVASKSGTTTETLSFYRHFYELAEKRLERPAGKHFVAITDPGSALAVEAERKQFRHWFENPEDIGGRYSALSCFGLVPMALLGMDIGRLLDRALEMQTSCGAYVPAAANPAVELGTVLGLLHRQGRDKVSFVLPESLDAFGYWIEQLLAESTGKQGVGLVPVEGEPVGYPGVYAADRVFVHMSTAEAEEAYTEQKLRGLEEAGHPVVRIQLGDKINLGAEFFRWEFATATAGALLEINPFDEPNVSESKENTRTLLTEWREKGRFNTDDPLVEENGIAVYGDPVSPWLENLSRDSLEAFLGGFVDLAGPPDYLALLTYFLRTPERHKTLQALRVSLRDRLKVATTLGYGPRYLHSTGQLHKGGPNRGVFVVITAEADEDTPIPGSEYGFATLQRAQALGDFRSLINKDRRVIRIHLAGDLDHGLREVARCIS